MSGQDSQSNNEVDRLSWCQAGTASQTMTWTDHRDVRPEQPVKQWSGQTEEPTYAATWLEQTTDWDIVFSHQWRCGMHIWRCILIYIRPCFFTRVRVWLNREGSENCNQEFWSNSEFMWTYALFAPNNRSIYFSMTTQSAFISIPCLPFSLSSFIRNCEFLFTQTARNHKVQGQAHTQSISYKSISEKDEKRNEKHNYIRTNTTG